MGEGRMLQHSHFCLPASQIFLPLLQMALTLTQKPQVLLHFHLGVTLANGGFVDKEAETPGETVA